MAVGAARLGKLLLLKRGLIHRTGVSGGAALTQAGRRQVEAVAALAALEVAR